MVLKKKYALPFPSPAHQHTRRLHFLKVQRGFLPCTSTCHTSLSQLRERHSLKCAAGLCLLWIALVSQEPAFHVSDFSQGALMLIHFTLLAHLFFFRLLKNLLWAFKYICGKKKLLAVTVQFLKGDFIDAVPSTSPHSYTVLSTQDAVCESQCF